jgi:hypothetical protein
MRFGYVPENTVMKLLQIDTAFTIDLPNGKKQQYGAQWLRSTNPNARKAKRIFDVVEGERFDTKYYNETEAAPTFDAEAEVVRINYSATSKDAEKLKLEIITEIKLEANRRILAIMPIHTQLNTIARGMILLQKQAILKNDLTVQEAAEFQAGVDRVLALLAIRVASDANEAMVNAASFSELQTIRDQFIWPE